ncbi:hypothetical protein H9Q69_002058 [Fusarium xylarioides]|uniref:Uncharacterized protein n=1 Tax=Fusarium xylarioides TaxID=221167 RepID=A0A9P7ISK9_9HYPO|nr:hypothetical protein H9Q70_000206 [Fusarium xylarioides]KAG5766124.1 hypothetical protein H9Q72_005824 [Fusarium xylarioides]KAG5784129.1 hypothetical protein H9Q73_002258 [Fusarium xylarioides]KAG5798924.1 hypothetical protein H9Q69_002058 [Fusarium xylarioides]KAG5815282.1 hypothetical protein H9Q71_002846 [Fusarium xylarioides]
MKFFTLIATIISVVSISAVPILNERAVGGLLICTGANSTGTCTHEVYTLNKCHQLSEPFLRNVTTFAPDGEHFNCYPRTTGCNDTCMSPTGCTLGPIDFNYEYKFNFSRVGWPKLFNSFDCSLKKTTRSERLFG